jgi:hypothetical protein
MQKAGRKFIAAGRINRRSEIAFGFPLGTILLTSYQLKKRKRA